MNYTKFHRKELKSKFKFRIIIFIGSIVLLIASILAMQLTYFCDDSMKNILSIIAGLFVSLIAWSGVAVFEFAMELKSQYVEERSDFIKRLNDILGDFDALIKKHFGHLQSKPEDFYQALGKQENVNFWMELYALVKETHKNNWRASLEKRVYANTEEFNNFCNYICKCRELLCAYFEANGRKDEFPVERFFVLHNEPVNMGEYLMLLGEQQVKIKEYWQQIKSIELNDEPLSTPEEIWCEMNNTIVSELNEFGGGLSRHQYVRCSFLQRCDKLIKTKPMDSVWCILHEILYKLHADKK